MSKKNAPKPVVADLARRITVLEGALAKALLCARCKGTGEVAYTRREYGTYERCNACNGKGH